MGQRSDFYHTAIAVCILILAPTGLITFIISHAANQFDNMKHVEWEPRKLDPPTPQPSVDGYRDWEDATGSYRTKAKLLETTGNQVRLQKPDGTVATVPLSKLSTADIEYLLRTQKPTTPELQIFKLDGPYGQGTAVIVHRFEDNTDADGNPLGLAATARHVLTARDEKTLIRTPDFKATYVDGTKSDKISFAVGREDPDIALVWLVVPKHIKAMEIADTKNLIVEITPNFEPTGRMAIFRGFGMGKLTDTRGRTSFRHKGVIQSDAILFPGQSGGAMLVDGKLAGIISGGNQWYTGANQPTSTWPARCADASLIPELIEEAKAVLQKYPVKLK